MFMYRRTEEGYLSNYLKKKNYLHPLPGLFFQLRIDLSTEPSGANNQISPSQLSIDRDRLIDLYTKMKGESMSLLEL